jgi:prepilin-type N-terminal cleavage/methylation domain-containing protein
MRTTARRSGLRPGAGFTLIEVMVALAIFSIGMLAMIPLFSTASFGTRHGKELTFATNLARTYVDKIRNTPYANIGLPTTPGCPNACTPPAGEIADNAPYVVTWSVTNADGAAYNFAAPPTPRIKRVTVRIVCSTCGGKRLSDPTQGLTMTTLVSERF